MKVCEIECKSLVTKSKLPDADYVINPYVGCCHGCLYCYAQFMCRFTGHTGEAWGSFMDIKRGGTIPKNLKEKTVLFGSVTDPYNPLEKKYETTRDILTRLKEQNTGANIEILTKSPLVLRDLDILKTLPNIRVGISLSTMDERFARLSEAHAATPQARIQTVKTLHDNGIPVYVFISPIFPYLSDWKSVASAVLDIADNVCFENLNLRANYKKDVLELVRKEYPEIYPEFSALYADKKKLRKYWEEMTCEIEDFMKDHTHTIYFFHEEIKK